MFNATKCFLLRKSISVCLLVCMLSLFGLLKAEAGWYAYEEICAALKKEGKQCDTGNPPTVTSKSFLVYWAGEVSDIYYDGSGSATRYKIRVTWVSDGSPYNCGQIIEKKTSEIKDLSLRSFAMRRCR